MGTRHLTVVVIDGAHRIAQYGQWDGYPKGQGKTVLTFLHQLVARKKLDPFKEACRRLKFYTASDQPAVDAMLKRAGDNWQKVHPVLTRDTGAGILQIVQDTKGAVTLQDEYNFAADSLFCEFVWLIDLDKGTLEVSKGFNKRKLAKSERFYPLESKREKDSKYHPCKLWKTFHLDSLPTLEEFLLLCKDEDEE